MDGSILGRDADLAALHQASESARLVGLTGPPGVGKSTLVAAWAARVPQVVVCRVEGATSIAELETKVAQTFDVPLPGPGARIEPLLAGHGATQLVLDGIDRLPVADLGATLQRWLEAAPHLRLVTAGRAAVGGEALVLAPLPRDAAEALFLERARAAGYAPRGTADERRSVAELVARLDGLPLALVLAGARAGVLSPLQIGQRLAKSFELAGDGSLRAALDLSWSMLTAHEREVLGAASAFRGAFDVTLLEAVLPGSNVLGAFESLVGKSLVQRTNEGQLAVWFRLLETVRRYVIDVQCAPIPEGFTDHVAARGAELAALVDTKDEALALEELAALADDLTFVVRHDDDPARIARAGNALSAWGVPRGLVALDVLEATARAAQPGEPAARAMARYWLARGQNRAGAVTQAQREIDAAVAEGATTLPAAMQARLEILRAHLALERGDLDAVLPALAPAQARLEGQGAWFLEGDVCNVRGRLAEARGHLPEAAEGFVAARAWYRRAGALRQAARALQNLAIVRDAEGRYGEARARFEEALAEHIEAGDPAGVADNLLNTGSLHMNAGALDLAEDLTRRALDEERRLGNRRFEGLALANLGLIAHLRGDTAAAKREYLAALAIFQEAHDRRVGSVLGMFLGALHAEEGARGEAQRTFAAARQELERVSDEGNLRVVHTLEALLVPLAEAETRLLSARQALGAGTTRSAELALAERIVTRALAPHDTSQPPPSTATLQIGPESRWFERAGQARVDLASRPSLRNVLAALVDAKTALPQEALFRAGWPGERVLPLAARDRVYTAVRTLRKLGLEGVLSRGNDGYFLHADIRLAPA